jgi:hypothetical protein
MLFIGCFDSTLALYTMNSLFFQILKLSEVLIKKASQKTQTITAQAFQKTKRE